MIHTHNQNIRRQTNNNRMYVARITGIEQHLTSACNSELLKTEIEGIAFGEKQREDSRINTR